MLKVGNVQLESPILLAPIAGHTDLAFRRLCREQGGVGCAYTDLLNSRAILAGTHRAMLLAETCKEDTPLGMQLYGAPGDPLPEAACWAIDHGAQIIDINMGCPVDKVAKKHGGSLLLRDCPSTLALVEKIITAVERHAGSRVPVTAKVRLGWDMDSIVAPQLARDLEEAGIAMVTVHGRTTVQKFSGTANWDAIGEVVAAVRSIPIIGNGDVKEPEDAIEMVRRTGCSGVMIARASLRTPWLFRRAADALTKGKAGPEPTFNEKIHIILRHLDLMETHCESRRLLEKMRKQISWYGKSLGHVKPLKEAIRVAPDIESMRAEIISWELPDGDEFSFVDHDRYGLLCRERQDDFARIFGLKSKAFGLSRKLTT